MASGGSSPLPRGPYSGGTRERLCEAFILDPAPRGQQRWAQRLEKCMPVPPEKIVPGKCYKFGPTAPRRVLLIQEKRVTYILRGDMAWSVARYYQDLDTFAKSADCEVNCTTLEDLTEDLAP